MGATAHAPDMYGDRDTAEPLMIYPLYPTPNHRVSCSSSPVIPVDDLPEMLYGLAGERFNDLAGNVYGLDGVST